jgi:(R,R)-butanediol dehydrogenase / meso-butanediol dehydrogenase / diacetyl reductase
MKALVYHGRNDVRYEDFPEPTTLGPQEVRLKVKCAALCHTDFNEYRNGPLGIARTPHPRTGRSIPLVIGHEFSGEVVEVGSEVQRIRVGDRVAVNAADSCRSHKCYHCRRGAYYLCPSGSPIGFARDGGLAEYAVVPDYCCYPLHQLVSFRAGALVEPLSVGMHAVKQAKLSLGTRAAVVGGGTVGLGVLQVLRAAGVLDVFVLETSESKKRFSQEFGAAAVINPSQVDPRKAIQDLTDGLGVDVAFECVGTSAALNTAVEVTRGGGKICVLGGFPGPFEFDFAALLAGEKTISTHWGYGDEFPLTIAMLGDGRLKAEPMITLTLSFPEALDEGLRQYEDKAATNVRMVIQM